MSKVSAAITLSIENEQCLLTGALTRQTIPSVANKQFKKLFIAEHATINFSSVDKVDTAGLAWVCALLEHANNHHCQLSFIHIPEQLAKLAKLSGVDNFLPIS